MQEDVENGEESNAVERGERGRGFASWHGIQ
jgi:hypothetical protein